MDDKRQTEAVESLTGSDVLTLTTHDYESDAEMPNLRQQAQPAAFADLQWGLAVAKSRKKQEEQPKNRDIMQELRFLTGLEKEPKDSFFQEAKKVQPVSLEEQYARCPEGTIRRIWADKASKSDLGQSGLPTCMQSLVVGKEDESELETVKYCKLAGLKYKTTRDKMKQEIDAIKKEMSNTLTTVLKKLDNIVASYKQMDME